jgi:hypothetical protein
VKESGGAGRCDQSAAPWQFRRAYVVVQGPWVKEQSKALSAVIGRMTAETVVAARAIAGCAERGTAGSDAGQAEGREWCVRRAVFAASCGGFSARRGCTCTDVRLCSLCASAPSRERLFVPVAMHGPYAWPHGQDHWFAGVTDAIFGKGCRPAQRRIRRRYARGEHKQSAEGARKRMQCSDFIGNKKKM